MENINVRHYVAIFGLATAGTPLLAIALVAALPQYTEQILDIFAMPAVVATAIGIAYYFIFRNARLPSRREYWKLVSYNTAVGVAATVAVNFLFADSLGPTLGMILLTFIVFVALQFVVLAVAFSNFIGRPFLWSLKKASTFPTNDPGH